MMDAKITTKKIPEKRFFVKVNKRPPKNAAQMHCTGNRNRSTFYFPPFRY